MHRAAHIITVPQGRCVPPGHTLSTQAGHIPHGSHSCASVLVCGVVPTIQSLNARGSHALLTCALLLALVQLQRSLVVSFSLGSQPRQVPTERGLKASCSHTLLRQGTHAH